MAVRVHLEVPPEIHDRLEAKKGKFEPIYAVIARALDALDAQDAKKEPTNCFQKNGL